jgi:transposase
VSLADATQDSLATRLQATILELATARAAIERLVAERDRFRSAYETTRLELELLKKRIFVAKAERVDTTQLELQFAEKLAELDRLSGTTGIPDDKRADAAGGEAGKAGGDATDGQGKGPAPKPRGHSKGGRRDVRELALDEQRLELTDPHFEELVASGKATRAGFEESSRLTWRGKGMGVLVVARAKYRVTDAHGVTDIEVALVPPELVARCLATPSLLAHILVAKHCDGLPLHRLEAILAREGCTIDRGTMCRWTEETGATLGASICEAMRDDALDAFCMATDATGVRVLPERDPDGKGKRQPCRRGQFFVQIADRDHILFSYTPRGTSDAAKELFAGYSGYVQADASSIFDALFGTKIEDGGREEIGCWSHGRRKFWEAASNHCQVAREALARIGRIFELDATWKDKPPNEIRHLRQTLLKTHVVAFLDWVAVEFKRVEAQRGALRSALGYVDRNRDALARFLGDGRLEMTNNGSERQLRLVAVGRKAWLFSGSDGHAQSAAEIMSLIASAKLHGLDPEVYLRDVIRVLPHWKGRPSLALAPKHWAATRALLDLKQLAAEYGPLDVPERFPHLPAPKKKSRSN